VGPREPVWTLWRREKKSLHRPYREMDPGRPGRSLVSTLTELPRLLLTLSIRFH